MATPSSSSLISALKHQHHLLLIIVMISSWLLQCSSSTSGSVDPIALPIKTQTLPRPPSSKLLFHHNVSLTISVSIGTPPQPLTLVLDTGSELPWLRCNTSAPSFSRTRSSSFSTIPCSSPTCTTQTKDLPIPASCDPHRLCHIVLSYADASSASGTLSSDIFLPGGSRAVFGCMDSTFSTSSEADTPAAGLLGMNRGSLSLVSQLHFPRFSYCISSTTSSGVLLLGAAAAAQQPLRYTPLIQLSSPLPYFDRAAYSLQLEGVRVSGKVLPLPKSVFEPDHTGAGQTMMDSGTQFTFLLGPVYEALKKEYLEQTKGLLRVLGEPNFVFQGAMDLCYRAAAMPENLPEVVLMFRGAEMRVSGRVLLYEVAGERRGADHVYCFTFGNSDLVPIEAYVIGHHHQRDMWVEYDLDQSRLGFGPANCDLQSHELCL